MTKVRHKNVGYGQRPLFLLFFIFFQECVILATFSNPFREFSPNLVKSGRFPGKVADFRKRGSVSSKSPRFLENRPLLREIANFFLKSSTFSGNRQLFKKSSTFFENRPLFRAEKIKYKIGGTSRHFFQAEDAHPSRRGSLPFIYFRGVRSPKFGKGGVI